MTLARRTLLSTASRAQPSLSPRAATSGEPTAEHLGKPAPLFTVWRRRPEPSISLRLRGKTSSSSISGPPGARPCIEELPSLLQLQQADARHHRRRHQHRPGLRTSTAAFSHRSQRRPHAPSATADQPHQRSSTVPPRSPKPTSSIKQRHPSSASSSAPRTGPAPRSPATSPTSTNSPPSPSAAAAPAASAPARRDKTD